jgi:hypothetical protein
MLIARSPLRISLAGGGTDLPAYYRQYGGKVINLAIDRYFYVFLKTSSSQEGIEVASADFHTYNILRNHTWQGGLELPKAIFQYFGIDQGVSLFLASEVPPGTGLGSSSTVAVGLIRALATSVGLHLTKQEIAELASYIEIEVLKAPIGCGVVEVTEDDLVTAFVEKPENPKSDLAAAGIYVTDRRLFDFFPEMGPNWQNSAYQPLDLGYHVIPRLVGQMKVFRINDFLMDIGTLDRYQQAQVSWTGIGEVS